MSSTSGGTTSGGRILVCRVSRRAPGGDTPGREQTFDARDNEVERLHFGSDGELVMSTLAGELNFARRGGYDSHGRLLIELHYDASNNLIEVEMGVCAYRRTYDNNGSLVGTEAVATAKAALK